MLAAALSPRLMLAPGLIATSGIDIATGVALLQTITAAPCRHEQALGRHAAYPILKAMG